VGILVVLVFGVRPALGRAGTSVKPAPAGTPKQLASAATAALNPPEPQPADPLRTRTQQILEEVSGHLKREPAQSSRLLQSWIHTE
jgi:flagellar M-ring protein FliF